MLDIGYDQSKQSWSEFSKEYCADTSYSNKYNKHTTEYVKKINPKALDNMLKCQQIKGLHASLRTGDDPKSFIFETVYINDSDGTDNPTFKSIKVVNATCDLTDLKPGDKITGTKTSVICTRTNEDEVKFVFNASKDPIWDTPNFIPSVAKSPPLPKHPELIVNCPKGERIFNDFTMTNDKEGSARAEVLQFNVNFDNEKVDNRVNNIGIDQEVECKILIGR